MWIEPRLVTFKSSTLTIPQSNNLSLLLNIVEYENENTLSIKTPKLFLSCLLSSKIHICMCAC